MAIGDLSVFAALKSKMSWHQHRQGLLAENVANAETPGYRGRDLKAFDFAEHVSEFSASKTLTSTTRPGHYSVGNSSMNKFGATMNKSFEVTPEGNGVTLEDEVMKVTANQMEYQAVTTLYKRSLQLIRTAIGR